MYIEFLELLTVMQNNCFINILVVKTLDDRKHREIDICEVCDDKWRVGE